MERNLLDQSISQSRLFTKRIRTTLRQNGIETLGELVERTEIELLRLKWFGGPQLRKVRDDLARHGLTLRQASQSLTPYPPLSEPSGQVGA